MSERDDGGHAFPSTFGDRGGMSLRDYFAGQVIGHLAAAVFELGSEKSADTQKAAELMMMTPKTAYELADAMLAARKAQL